MNNRQFNGTYRPLVKAAWLQFCEETGEAPNNKTAKELWYRQKLHDLTQGRIHSTKGIHPKMQHFLIDAFKAGSNPADSIPIKGWSDAQTARFHELAKSAWQKDVIDGSDLQFIPWIAAILKRHHRDLVQGFWEMPNMKESFDTIMADLAIRANDEYWAKRTAEQGEIRIRYQLRRFLADLDYLDKTFTHDWSYVQGIYKQAQILPADINDCPSETLWRVLAMLDTHIRRLCKDLGIKPMELPTRSNPHSEQPHIIAAEAKHLHISHALEHIPVPVETKYCDKVPF